jgi:hypothetical protein
MEYLNNARVGSTDVVTKCSDDRVISLYRDAGA